MINAIYSDWTKVDLHIHTDLSKSTKEGDYKGLFTVEDLITKINENEVGIFSLTDHNIINVAAYKQYYQSCNESSPLLLLGVELDIESGKSDGSAKDYHSLLIFNISNSDGAQRISDILEKAYLEKGITDKKKRSLLIDDVVKIFPDEDFFFIPHAGNKKSITDRDKSEIENTQRMVLLMQSAFEKVPEKAKQKYNEGFDKILNPEFKGRNDLAYIDFSDNHNISKYPCVNKGDDNVSHTFWYIKGRRSFETLRLAFIDPESRIKSSADYQKITSTSGNPIEKLLIEKNKQLESCTLEFSPHLNVIIGGRSSGKSLLMNALGFKFGAVDSKATSSYKDAVDLSKIRIKTKLDSEFKDQSSANPHFVYINQGDIVNYFEGRKLQDLATKSGKSKEYQLALSRIKARKSDLQSANENWLSAYEKLFANIKYEFVIYNQTISEMHSQEYLFIFHRDLLLEKYANSESLKNSQTLAIDVVDQINEIAKDANFELSFDDIEYLTAFVKFIETKRLVVERKSQITAKRVKFIDRSSAIITEANSAQSIGAKKKQEAITSFKSVIEKSKERFKFAKDLKRKCELVETFDYSKIESFDLNEEIAFSIETASAGSTKELIYDAFNGANNSVSIYLNLIQLLKAKILIKNYKTNTPADLRKKIQSLLAPIYSAIDIPQDYLDYKNGETSKNKSPGFNSEQYLKVILNHPSTELIFIDQPEDNLGNRFIAGDLVDILREIKFKKQVFLVTHNPSIVVYGDAENIIISNNDGNSIAYKQVVLEEKVSQKEICQILDGGEYVFDNRSRKYNIKRILKESQNA